MNLLLPSHSLPLVRLHPRDDTLIVSQGHTVLVTDRDGFIAADAQQGLFVYQTRLLSRYRYRIENRPPQPVALSNVQQHSWLGYYIAPPPQGAGAPGKQSPIQHSLELRVARFVGAGLHEDVDFTNFTQQPVHFVFQVEVDADFADQQEAGKERKQHGQRQVQWRQVDGAWELVFDYQAEHAYDHQGNKGTAHLHRSLTLRIERAGSEPIWADGCLTFPVGLAPQASWHACLLFLPTIDGKELRPVYPCHAFHGAATEYERKREIALREATSFSAPREQTLTPVVLQALEQGRQDLAALRLYDRDHDERSWIPAAGVPVYVGLFGRDILMTALEAMLVSPALMRGALQELPRWQGTVVNDWRDEQPGRMIHQAQAAPLSALHFNPLGRYYGSMTTSLLYNQVLFAYWITTGDSDRVRSLVEPALKAIHWLDQYADLNGDGFYEYTTRSTQGLKNQSWKDSGDALVYEDGRQVPDPIAAADVQALAYLAKLRLGEILRWLDRDKEAHQLLHEAEELKKRFNETFWLEDEGIFAEALDPKRHPVRSIGSDTGACIAAGIADEALVPRAAQRLMQEDLFSGWGIRTLSSQHPAYNPYSYQRGSVWPAETSVLALGFMRYGLHEPVERVCRAQFEAAALFDYCRLPEVFAGHPRDAAHPFPALYPRANWPQAWSSAAVFSTLQALLGIFPFAPLHALVVDPYLPAWLPEITLQNLRIGDGQVTIRFYRKENGKSSYEVLDKHGSVHVLRQPSPWSLTAGIGERIKDLLTSL